MWLSVLSWGIVPCFSVFTLMLAPLGLCHWLDCVYNHTIQVRLEISLWRFFKYWKIKVHLTQLCLSWYIPKDFILHVLCRSIFITRLFTITRRWRNLRRPSTDEWIMKMWCINSGILSTIAKMKLLSLQKNVWNWKKIILSG